MNKMVKVLVIISFVAVLLVEGCSSSPTSNGGTVPPTPATQPASTPSQPTAVPTTSPPSPAPTVTQGNQVGNLAPNFQLRNLNGQTVSLFDLRGKPVLINFWATWCPPCKYEMPFLQQVHDSWSAKGLVLLAVDIGETQTTVQKFMTDLNLTLTVPMDANRNVAKDYGITAIPTSFFIDKNGVIQQKVIGAFANVAAIESQLSKIIP